jgi:glycosyltransferase involved in cell wall biosynthesis
MNNFNVRVIVPCFDSDLTIEKCISSIYNSKGVKFEVFLIDDGNNTRLDTIKNDYPIHIVRTSGQEGAGRSRNIGTYGFKGQVIVFVDSDVQIHHDTLASLIKPIQENSAEATVGGYSKPTGGSFFNGYKFCYLSFRYNTKRKYLSNTFWSAICAIDYKVFRNADGFKECFSGAGPEDIDLGVELSKQGARILSVPQAAGIHLRDLSFLTLLKNDLRKGSEDIYIHLTRKIPIKDNRHVHKSDIIAVLIACAIPVLFLLQYFYGSIPLLAAVFLYFILRIRYIKIAFGREGLLFMIGSFFLTFILDLIRGFAVINGTVIFGLEIGSSGKYKAFAKQKY